MHSHESIHDDRNGVGIDRHLVQVEKNPETVLEVAEEMKADPASHTKEVMKLKKPSPQLTGMGGRAGGVSSAGRAQERAESVRGAGRRRHIPPRRHVGGGGEVMHRCTPDLKSGRATGGGH